MILLYRRAYGYTFGDCKDHTDVAGMLIRVDAIYLRIRFYLGFIKPAQP